MAIASFSEWKKEAFEGLKEALVAGFDEDEIEDLYDDAGEMVYRWKERVTPAEVIKEVIEPIRTLAKKRFSTQATKIKDLPRAHKAISLIEAGCIETFLRNAAQAVGSGKGSEVRKEYLKTIEAWARTFIKDLENVEEFKKYGEGDRRIRMVAEGFFEGVFKGVTSVDEKVEAIFTGMSILFDSRQGSINWKKVRELNIFTSTDGDYSEEDQKAMRIAVEKAEKEPKKEGAEGVRIVNDHFKSTRWKSWAGFLR